MLALSEKRTLSSAHLHFLASHVSPPLAVAEGRSKSCYFAPCDEGIRRIKSSNAAAVSTAETFLPSSVPSPSKLARLRLFERLNRSMLCLRADVAVAFEHLTADVSCNGLDRLLVHARIPSQPRDERLSHVLWPVKHASGFAGNSPRLTVVSTGAIRDSCRGNRRKA